MLYEILHEAETWVAVGFVLVIALLVWKGVRAWSARCWINAAQ